tara:strand:+ start:2860 stop:3306 length:447 start_codon:yes stop_codon:yes gene_type:complete
MNARACQSRALRWGVALLLGGAPLALAVAAESSEPSIYSLRYMVQVAGSLLLVLGCMLAVLFLIRKLQGMPVGEKNALRVLGSLKVGTREKILLLEAGDEQLLIGVASGSVRTLHVFAEPVAGTADHGRSAGTFDTLLKRSSAASRTA